MIVQPRAQSMCSPLAGRLELFISIIGHICCSVSSSMAHSPQVQYSIQTLGRNASRNNPESPIALVQVGLKKVIDEFHDALLKHPKLGPVFKNVDTAGYRKEEVHFTELAIADDTERECARLNSLSVSAPPPMCFLRFVVPCAQCP